MKKQKISKTNNSYVLSSNNYEDPDCLVCKLLLECEMNNIEPTEEELDIAFDLERNKPQSAP